MRKPEPNAITVGSQPRLSEKPVSELTDAP